MRHFTTPEFWQLYNRLSQELRDLADKNYELLKADPSHPSLHFKKVGDCGRCGSACITGPLPMNGRKAFVWFWIGSHAGYDAFMP